MADFRKMYAKLFNAITDATSILQTAQAEAEELYLAQKEPNVTVLDAPDDEE